MVRYRDPLSGEVGVRWVYDLEQDPEELIIQGNEFGSAQGLIDLISGRGSLSFEKHFATPDEQVTQGLDALGYLGEGEDEEN